MARFVQCHQQDELRPRHAHLERIGQGSWPRHTGSQEGEGNRGPYDDQGIPSMPMHLAIRETPHSHEAEYKTSDPIAEIRYTANPSRTGKEMPMLKRRVVRPRL